MVSGAAAAPPPTPRSPASVASRSGQPTGLRNLLAAAAILLLLAPLAMVGAVATWVKLRTPEVSVSSAVGAQDGAGVAPGASLGRDEEEAPTSLASLVL